MEALNKIKIITLKAMLTIILGITLGSLASSIGSIIEALTK